MQGKGYWYKSGKLFELDSLNHIDYIINYPELFYLTPEYIQDTYDKHNERIRQEGKAREEIIRKVSELGWIRIRHYFKPKDYWSIQYDVYPKRRKDIKSLVEDLILVKEEMNENDELVLLGYKDNSKFLYSFMNGGAIKFLTENKDINSIKINEIQDFKDFCTDNFLSSNLTARKFVHSRFKEKFIS